MKYVIFTVFLFFNGYVLGAGNISGGKITQIRVDGNGRAMIMFNKNVEGAPPSCVHVAYTNALAIDAATDGGKAVLSFAMSAQARQATVHVIGLGVCGVYGGSFVETWDYGVSE